MIWGNSTSFSAVAAKRAITNKDDDDSASTSRTSTALVTPTKPKNKSAASSSADGSKMKASVLTIWNKAEQHVLSFQQTQDQLCSAEGLCTLLAKNVSALHVKVKKALESDVYAKYSEGWEDRMPDTRGMKALDVLKVADKRLPLILKFAELFHDKTAAASALLAATLALQKSDSISIDPRPSRSLCSDRSLKPLRSTTG